MSTVGSFNSKNPTVKRILKEASELAQNPTPDYHAEPLEDNLFEWHFTLRGPPAPSPYAGGIYHGRIVLPSAYPLRPPSFRFTTPTGRFEVNREICLSISGHHEETWQPAWGIRTALVAIRSFMDTGAKGQLGGLDTAESARKRMAKESVAWKCPICGKTNAEIMRERESAVKETEGQAKEEVVPDELRLAYREDLSDEGQQGTRAPSDPVAENRQAERRTRNTPSTSAATPRTQATAAGPAPRVAPLRQQATDQNVVPPWLDKAIYGVLGALIFMVLRRLF